MEWDTNGDGRADAFNHYQQGNLVRQERDGDFDGRVDIWLDVEDGEIVRGRMDVNRDGRVDVRESYEGGLLTRQALDGNGDGIFETTHYIEGNRHVRTEEDRSAAGRVDRWTFYDADEKPRLVLEDLNADGMPDLQTRFGPDGKPQITPIGEDEGDAQTVVDVDTAQKPGDIELQEVTVQEKRDWTAASDREVRDRDFRNFPRCNPSDLVRVIPGVHVSQHTGGAKAYQYFLRGFDAEHGQDLAAYLDGIPLNEPSQVHGHGYLDLHFLIPETIDMIRVIKGPYDPEFGNFATAGAINFVPRRHAPQNTIGATAGMFGTARVMSSFSVEKPYLLVGAAETDHSDGYTDPGDSDAYRANTGHTFLRDEWTINLMSNHYGQDSAATDVVPEKWVKDGRLDRYGSLDTSDRVASNRQLVGLTADWADGGNNLRLQGWYDYKRTTIWSNYTFYLLNPERGDQQEMRDNRSVTGVNLRYSNTAAWGKTVWDTAVGVQWRYDLVDQLLGNTAHRERWNVINNLQFSENSLGLWLRENLMLTSWLTVVPGVRYDVLFYEGEGTQDERFFNIYTNLADTRQDVRRDWSETAAIASPKASVVFTPLKPWNIFLNYGEGFFSNTTLQMANAPESTIPKVRGGEIGTRVFFWGTRVTFAAAAWFVNKEKDLVFDPQTGLSVTKEETQRNGLDGEIRVSPLPWLYLTTDASYVEARFVESRDRIPNGPITLMTNGVGWSHDLGLRGMVRGRYMGPRELDQGDWAEPYYVLDLVAGYDTPAWGVELAIDNVLDTEWEDAVFSYETRPEPNGETLNGIHWTPGTPFSSRLTVTAKF